MTDITVVTTFHKPGLEQYGQRFLDSFAQKVDKKIKLLVYAESCQPINPDPDQIKIFDAFEALPKLNEFKSTWKNVPKANGIPPEDIKARRPRDWHKEFKWHAIRFANKVYAVFDACQRSQDWCVWMDADTFVHSDWSYDDFKKQLPDNVWLTYVGRGKGSQTWPECGFYGMNLRDPVCKLFLEEFERMYEDAENGIFTLEEWHDSYVFGDILSRYKARDPNVLDYSAEMYLKEAKTGGGGHPLINGILGTWIDHMKGVRKQEGRSRAKDIMVNRTENYWKQ
tara:strand:+ start:82 stop:927 length:846 start_codon:yes stop_codon:yes gene_type:complete